MAEPLQGVARHERGPRFEPAAASEEVEEENGSERDPDEVEGAVPRIGMPRHVVANEHRPREYHA